MALSSSGLQGAVSTANLFGTPSFPYPASMGRAKPPVIPLHEFEPGQSGDAFALLVERVKGVTRDGKPFYTVRFGNSRRTVAAMIWNDSPWFDDCESEWKDGQFYKLRLVYQEHPHYGPQIELQNIRLLREEDRQDGFDLIDFVECSRFDRDQMYAALVDLVRQQISDPPLRQLVLTILTRHEGALKRLPASTRHYYPFHGGLLEHTLSVTRTALLLAQRYARYYPELRPPLNIDLIVAGAVLHDLGRLLELEKQSIVAEPTVAGRLLGHLLLGRDLVRDTARELGNINPDLLQLLEHLLITHLTLPEWGSPRLPLIPEVLILHHADDLDAKLEMYVRCLVRDEEAGLFTARDPLLGRQLYKGRTV